MYLDYSVLGIVLHFALKAGTYFPHPCPRPDPILPKF